jgi:3'-5' exoribonuclease
MISTQTELISLKKGNIIDHYLLLKKSELKVTKHNKEYWAFDLGDQTTTLGCKMWEGFKKFYSSVNTGEVVKVEGIIEEYNGTLQINISSVRSLYEDENISVSDFLPVSKKDFNEMVNEFMLRIDRIGNFHLKTLLKNIFNEDRFSKFSSAPAGKLWHHAYIHGLLEHTLEIIKICDLMSNMHPEINRDILISGAMIHDLGKIEELTFESSFEYSDKGKLLGHIIIAAIIVNDEINKIHGFPEELKNCLMHLVLAHQGKLEYASPVVPKTLEAITLYQADELSAKVNAYKNALVERSGEGRWTKFISLVSTDLFDHGLSNITEKEISKSLFD